ncbi:MAG: DNA-directed RNA polymerase subunit omega [Bacteroidota bacterium]
MKRATNLIPRDFAALTEVTGNTYEAVAIIARRAKQLATITKRELDEKLAAFVPIEDTLEEVFENQEQIEISKSYEARPKSINLAIEELLAGELQYHYADTAETQQA